MLQQVINSYISDESNSEINNELSELLERQQKEATSVLSKITQRLFDNVVYKQRQQLTFIVKDSLKLELELASNVIDITHTSCKSIAINEDLTEFTFDISINGRPDLYTFNGNEINQMTLALFDPEINQVQHIDLNQVLVLLQRTIMFYKNETFVEDEIEQVDELLEVLDDTKLPSNVIKHNFTKH